MNNRLIEHFCEEGFLISNPVLTSLKGNTYCKFRFLVKTPEGNKYFHITSWGNQALNCHKFLQKGSGVIVQGKLFEKTYDDGRCYMEVDAELVKFKSNLKKQKEVC